MREQYLALFDRELMTSKFLLHIVQVILCIILTNNAPHLREQNLNLPILFFGI